MPITLTVISPGDPPTENRYTFQGDRVTIGRGAESTLVLPDPKRVVSKEHAAVVRSATGYDLVDLESKNLTYLHGQPLEPGRPYPLHDGDTFSLGEFSVRCSLHLDAPAEADRTVLDGAFVNPFLEDAAVLAATVRSMAKAYEREGTAQRDEAVYEAVRTAALQSGEGDGDSPILRLVGAALAGEPVEGVRSGTPTPAAALAVAPAPAAAPAAGGPSDRILEAMLRSLARVLAIPQRFRHEFIGQTVVQGPDVAPLLGGDARTLRRHLLEPAISAEEAERRAQNLQDAADTLALHHVALLDGYRASVRDGADALLDAVDPTPEGNPEAGAGLLGRLLPFYRRAKVGEQAVQKWRELREGDWAVAERRVFRPAFIRAYLPRAEPTDRRGGDTGSDESRSLDIHSTASRL